MGDFRRSGRMVYRAAVCAALGFGFASCSSGSTSSKSLPASPEATTIPTPTTALGAADDAATATTVAALTAVGNSAPGASPAVDGAALLQSAVAAMATGYHFTTTLTVDGVVVLTADGDRVGDGTRLGITQGDVSVQYVITPAATWVQPEGGDWQLLDSESANSDPIAALASPSAVTVSGVDGTATMVDVTVAAATLGLGGDTSVTMSARIDNGAITAVGYTTAVNGKPAVMRANIGPVVDGSPVVAPI